MVFSHKFLLPKGKNKNKNKILIIIKKGSFVFMLTSMEEMYLKQVNEVLFCTLKIMVFCL